MEMFELFPQLLRRLRKLEDKSQKVLEHEADLGTNAVSRLENGERSPSLDELGRLLRALGMDRRQFLVSYEELEQEELRKRAVESGEVYSTEAVPPDLVGEELAAEIRPYLENLPPELQIAHFYAGQLLVIVVKPRPA